jgi:hypothetical protein
VALAPRFARAGAYIPPARAEEPLHRAITERERFEYLQRLRIPTAIVEFEPERVARYALADRDREFDKKVVE